MPFTIEEAKLKKLLKSAVAEVLKEQRDLVREAVMEAVEEVGLVRAIEEGAGSKAAIRYFAFCESGGEHRVQKQFRQRPSDH